MEGGENITPKLKLLYLNNHSMMRFKTLDAKNIQNLLFDFFRLRRSVLKCTNSMFDPENMS